MSQLYARVYTQILTSSIAEDFTTRHVFEDFLKVCERGIVDSTRESLARIFNIPLETLNACVAKLEAPDPKSRDQRCEGRRLVRLNDHRDWGWEIVNWEEYEKMRNREDVAARVAKHRANRNPMSKTVQRRPRLSNDVPPCPRENVRDCPQAEAEAEAEAVHRERERGASARLHGLPATVEEVIEAGRRSIPKSIPEATCRAFWSHYESQARTNENGQVFWVTSGENPSVITNWREKLKTWRADLAAKKPTGQSRYHVPNI